MLPSFVTSTTFEVEPITPSKPSWGQGAANAWQEISKPEIENEEEKKKEFGLELARNTGQAFKAACNVFGDDTNKALWASRNWLTDPVVLVSRDLYLEAVQASASLLDKEQFAHKVLKFADEKNQSGTFYLADTKDRLAALKLYAEVQGFVGKASDLNIHNNVTLKSISVRFIEPEVKQQAKIIDNEPNEFLNNSRVKIKLVG